MARHFTPGSASPGTAVGDHVEAIVDAAEEVAALAGMFVGAKVNWGHVGDLARVRELLNEALGGLVCSAEGLTPSEPAPCPHVGASMCGCGR